MLNELTGKVFGFDFESWVTQGYYEEDYIPYSFVEEGKIVMYSKEFVKFEYK